MPNRIRLAWNAAARKHAQGRGEQLIRDFSQPGYVIFDAWEQALLANLPVRGKRVAQLPCNNGRELISLVNFGAQSGGGFDIADDNIQQANHLKSCANAACDFYRTNILDIPTEFNGQFDFVYISEGSLIWFESLIDYFAVVARLLRPAGWALIHEAHPFTHMFEYTFDEQTLPTFQNSYFTKGPLYYESSGLDYVGKTEYSGPATIALVYRDHAVVARFSEGKTPHNRRVWRVPQPHLCQFYRGHPAWNCLIDVDMGIRYGFGFFECGRTGLYQKRGKSTFPGIWSGVSRLSDQSA